MKKLRNPFLKEEGYHCFGCAPTNDLGLQMEFYEDEASIKSFWQPRADFEGFSSVVHGGIQATLIDETASWCIFVKLKTAGVTSGMEIAYHSPVRTSHGPLTIEATLDHTEKNKAYVGVTITDAEGRCCTSATCIYSTYSERLAVRKLNYPGHSAFYD